jgi:hypothetical protein
MLIGFIIPNKMLPRNYSFLMHFMAKTFITSTLNNDFSQGGGEHQNLAN